MMHQLITLNLFSSIPRVTIITNNIYSGPAYSINNAMHLIQGHYVHFIFGTDTIEPTSSVQLIQACEAMGTELAFGLNGTITHDNLKIPSLRETGDIVLLDKPIGSILENKITNIDTIGNSGTLVTTSLLEKISGADQSVFLHNTSLGLRFGKYSKFAAIKSTIYYTSYNTSPTYTQKFTSLQFLSSIANFIADHPELADNYKPEIYKALWSRLWSLDKYKVRTLPKYLLSRYINQNLDCKTLLEVYKQYIHELEIS
jgi:hypothetical protein